MNANNPAASTVTIAPAFIRAAQGVVAPQRIESMREAAALALRERRICRSERTYREIPAG